MVLIEKEPKSVYVWSTAVKSIRLWSTQVRPELPPYLCFTANTSWSTVRLRRNWSPYSVSLETSTDGENWSSYTIWNTITLSNVWDKVYFRNTSETTTWFSKNGANFYYFSITWSVSWSWDTTTLLNKNWTDTVSSYCFNDLFTNCTSLTTAPSLPATTLAEYCYTGMFYGCKVLTTAPKLPATILWICCYQSMFNSCTSLTVLPKLPATTLTDYCYREMFANCSNIKLSSTQTWEYQTEYRIPTTWTWTTWTNSLQSMFSYTWWSWTWTPTINTTYYTSNTVV